MKYKLTYDLARYPIVNISIACVEKQNSYALALLIANLTGR